MLLVNAKVAEVSQACGYNSPGYFNRIFKEYYKCTPKEYDRKNRENE